MILSFFRTIITWIYSIVFLLSALFFSLLTFQIFAEKIWHFTARVWGRSCLWLMGVRLVEVNKPSFSGADPRIIMFNHQSILDILWFCSVSPPRFSAIAKKEFMYIPVINLAFWASGQVFIDRGNRMKALGVLNRLMSRLKRDRRSLVIAPEGTRTLDGEMLPFKKGGFYMAVESGFSVYPVVVSGAFECMPPGSFTASPGVIHLQYLPPVETADWSTATLGEHITEVRELMSAAVSNLKKNAELGSEPT